jgi:hypothetical protein
MVAVFIFFVAIEPLRNLQGESRLLQGYGVTEAHSLKATHHGAPYDSENCAGCGEKRAANLSPSAPTWRCRNRHGVCDNSFVPRRIGR